jgi:hypothetical protein
MIHQGKCEGFLSLSIFLSHLSIYLSLSWSRFFILSHQKIRLWRHETIFLEVARLSWSPLFSYWWKGYEAPVLWRGLWLFQKKQEFTNFPIEYPLVFPLFPLHMYFMMYGSFPYNVGRYTYYVRLSRILVMWIYLIQKSGDFDVFHNLHALVKHKFGKKLLLSNLIGANIISNVSFVLC